MGISISPIPFNFHGFKRDLQATHAVIFPLQSQHFFFYSMTSGKFAALEQALADSQGILGRSVEGACALTLAGRWMGNWATVHCRVDFFLPDGSEHGLTFHPTLR